nr:unnamed protein product [Spirometra erinaceieuropaei]
MQAANCNSESPNRQTSKIIVLVIASASGLPSGNHLAFIYRTLATFTNIGDRASDMTVDSKPNDLYAKNEVFEDERGRLSVADVSHISVYDVQDEVSPSRGCPCFKRRRIPVGDIEHENCHLSQCPTSTKKNSNTGNVANRLFNLRFAVSFFAFHNKRRPQLGLQLHPLLLGSLHPLYVLDLLTG